MDRVSVRHCREEHSQVRLPDAPTVFVDSPWRLESVSLNISVIPMFNSASGNIHITYWTEKSSRSPEGNERVSSNYNYLCDPANNVTGVLCPNSSAPSEFFSNKGKVVAS